MNMSEENHASKRSLMVSRQIKARGIKDDRVLAAMEKVPRHEFVPENEKSRAYADHPLSIGEGQTISQPYIVALMTELLELDKNDRVLEIGTGSGYQAAVLAEIVKKVYSVEIIKKLASRAEEILAGLDYKNIKIKHGNGYLGWKEHAPYDGIMATCAPEEVPEALINQLAEGGRLVLPVGGVHEVQKLLLMEKSGGKIKKKSITSVRFVPMVGESP